MQKWVAMKVTYKELKAGYNAGVGMVVEFYIALELVGLYKRDTCAVGQILSGMSCMRGLWKGRKEGKSDMENGR